MCGHTDSATQTLPSSSLHATMYCPSHCLSSSSPLARERRLATKYHPSGNGKSAASPSSMLQSHFKSGHVPGWGNPGVTRDRQTENTRSPASPMHWHPIPTVPNEQARLPDGEPGGGSLALLSHDPIAPHCVTTVETRPQETVGATTKPVPYWHPLPSNFADGPEVARVRGLPAVRGRAWTLGSPPSDGCHRGNRPAMPVGHADRHSTAPPDCTGEHTRQTVVQKVHTSMVKYANKRTIVLHRNLPASSETSVGSCCRLDCRASRPHSYARR